MNKTIHLLCIVCWFTQCKSTIKNENDKVVQEPGTEITIVDTTAKEKPTNSITEKDLYGFWVGYFLQDDNTKFVPLPDESWQRENKITISIDTINKDKVIGHSVVAGNDRPFSGTIQSKKDTFYFDVKEPGDNQYDGAFTFSITKDTVLKGTWQAFKKIEIPKREYTLLKKQFTYNPDIMLQTRGGRSFIDWEKKAKKHYYGEDMKEWYEEFVTATDSIYTINASNKLLTEGEVENLKKGDLYIIRNTIYARHGYSFKNRPLRIFFDAQDWYIPVYTDIKNDFTDIEKKNIQLLLRYEKNAKEYYDSFGR